MNKINKNKKLLLERLLEIQNKNLFIRESDINMLAREFQKSPAEIYDTVSFYANFNLEKPSKKIIKLCQSPTCHSKKNEKLLNFVSDLLNIKIGESNDYISLETCQCIGMCDKGPIMTINNNIYTSITEEKIKYILKIEGLI